MHLSRRHLFHLRCQDALSFRASRRRRSYYIKTYTHARRILLIRPATEHGANESVRSIRPIARAIGSLAIVSAVSRVVGPYYVETRRQRYEYGCAFRPVSSTF